MDWTEILHAVAPHASSAIVTNIAPYLDTYLTKYDIVDPIEVAMFLAMAAEETAGFKTLVEYGDPAYFTKMYDIRGGRPALAKSLGNTEAGDGYRYRGQGIFQITGRSNFSAYGAKMGIDLIAHPELLQTGLYAVWSACLYWSDHHCGPWAREGNIKTVTKKINGGLNGLAEREAYFTKAKPIIAEAMKAAKASSAPIAPAAPPVPKPILAAPAPRIVMAPVTSPIAAPVRPSPAAPSPDMGGLGKLIGAFTGLFRK